MTKENGNSDLINFVIDKVDNNLIKHTLDCDKVDVVVIDRDKLPSLMKGLRDDFGNGFKHLSHMTAVDYPDDDYRFQAIYELRKHDDFLRIRIKINISSHDAWVPSISGLYPSALWHEREMMELFGIEVRGHPDPRKLILPDWVDQHPLRKDFPHDGEELWEFHEQTIKMFNDKSEYQGDLDDPWLELNDY